MADEYLTVSELAERLKVKPKTIRNKMTKGVFQRGVHYFSPAGMAPRFKWSAVVKWLEETDPQNGHQSMTMGPHAGQQKTRGFEIGDV
jgi:hypothetical protein